MLSLAKWLYHQILNKKDLIGTFWEYNFTIKRSNVDILALYDTDFKHLQKEEDAGNFSEFHKKN